MNKINGSLTIIVFFLLVPLFYFCPVSAAKAVESGIIDMRVGIGENRAQDAQDKTFTVFTGEQDILMTVKVSENAYDKKTKERYYDIEPFFEETRFDLVSQEYDGGTCEFLFRTKKMADSNTNISLNMRMNSESLPRDQERASFRILKPSVPHIEVLSPASQVDEGRVKFLIDFGITEEEAELRGMAISWNISGGEIHDKDSFKGNGVTKTFGNGVYAVNLTVTDDIGYLEQDNFVFEVKNTKESTRAQIKVTCQESAVVGKEFPVYLNGSYSDWKNAFYYFYEGDKQIGKIGYSDDPRAKKIMLRFDSVGTKRVRVELRKFGSDRALDSASFQITVYGTPSEVPKEVSGLSAEVRGTWSPSEKEITEAWEHIYSLDFNANRNATVGESFTIDIMKLKDTKTEIAPGAVCIVEVRKGKTFKLEGEQIRLRYDPKDAKSLTVERTFSDSIPRVVCVQIWNNPSHLIFGRCDLLVNYTYSGGEEMGNETGSEGRCMRTVYWLWNWLKGN